MFKGKVKILFLLVFLVLFQIQGSPGLVEKDQVQATQNLQLGKNSMDNITGKLQLSQNYGKLPLYFIPNNGQVNDLALFYANTSRYTLWLTEEGLVFDSSKKVEGNTKIRSKRDRLPNREMSEEIIPLKFERDVSRLIFLNANETPKVIATETTKHKVNYFKGNDRSKWQTNILSSLSVLYTELYRNIDLKVYGKESQIEYDFIVKPGGEVFDIEFEYQDVDKTSIDSEGNLIISTKFGELTHKNPLAYQEIDGEIVDVAAHFKKMKTNSYGFEVEEYNRNYDLIIDPLILVYSSYLGGSGADQAYDITVDAEGAAYVTGYTTSTDFPTTNPIYGANAGDMDVFVAKINPAGDALVYSTYLGGLDSDVGKAISLKPPDLQSSSSKNTAYVADSTENAVYLTGWTNSTDFPTESPTQASNGGGYDAFVTKINAWGTALDFSTFIGGSNTEAGMDIDVDSEGNAYAVGYTFSTDFPATPNSLQAAHAGGADGFISYIDFGNSAASGLNMNNENGPTSFQFPCGGPYYEFFDVVSCSQNLGTCYVGTDCDGFNNWPNITELLDATTVGGVPPYAGFVCLEGIGEEGILQITDAVLCGNELTNLPLHIDTFCAPGDNTDDSVAFFMKTEENGHERATLWDIKLPELTADEVLNYELYGEINDGLIYPFLDKDEEEIVDALYAGAGHDPKDINEFGVQSVVPELAGITVLASPKISMRTAASNAYTETLYYLGGSGVDKAYSIALGQDGSVYIAGGTNSTDFPTMSFQDDYGGDIDGFVAKYQRIYELTIYAGTGGTTNPVPGTSNRYSLTEVTITATPETGYVFLNWTGDVSSTNKSITITMDSDKSVTANFLKISPPSNFAGQKVVNRSLFRAEYINNLTWQVHPDNQDISKYRIYLIDGDTQSLVVEVNAGTLRYMHRNVERNKAYNYSIVAVNSDGIASAPANITVQ
ncbi:SBBP repeat-containing protein [Acidobacteriota bacterium]